MPAEIVEARSCYISRPKSYIRLYSIENPFAYLSANVLVDNDPLAPCFEVNRYLRLKFDEPTLVAFTGRHKASVNGRSISEWRAIPVCPGAEVEVTAEGGAAYLGVCGLSLPFTGKYEVNSGVKVEYRAVNEPPSDLKARYVPQSFIERVESVASSSSRGLMLVTVGELEKVINSFLRHLELAKQAAARGGELIRVKINGSTLDVWVEEL